MKLIEREYLNRLIDVINIPDIKIITGVRRAGKSKLMEIFKNYIINNIKNQNIIAVNYSLIEFENLKDYHKLYEYVSSHYKENKHNFILIDEVQMCDGFEKAINSFHAEEKYDIYLTGSNAFLSSSDLATLFTGRTFEIAIYPFSFKEFNNYFEYEDIDTAFDKYFFEGGMSGSYIYNKEEDKYEYVADIYKTLIVRDIIQKYGIKNEQLLYKLNDFLMDNISRITSLRKISDILISNNEETNHKTIGNYISYLCNAFLYYKIKRYDIQGKNYLTSQDKYYIVDQSFKYALLGKKDLNKGNVYENIVAIELLRRGYDIYVGELYGKEIDFVAMKKDEKLYIQVSSNIEEEDTFKREVNSLLKIRDAYPKILIARTKSDMYTYEGIQVYDIARWLNQRKY